LTGSDVIRCPSLRLRRAVTRDVCSCESVLSTFDSIAIGGRGARWFSRYLGAYHRHDKRCRRSVRTPAPGRLRGSQNQKSSALSPGECKDLLPQGVTVNGHNIVVLGIWAHY